MPELPDLQVFSRNLNKLFKGRTVKNVKVPNHKKLNVPITKLKDTLEGSKLTNVKRAGKELHFEFDNKHVLGIHLMLHGQLQTFDSDNKAKYSIIELLFEDNKGLVITDFQGAATPTLDPADNNVPDALEVTESYLTQKLTKTKNPVKSVLMDQKVVRGIGNAYADEILFDAKLSPFCISKNIPKEKVKQLTKSIKDVLAEAEKQIIKARPDIISGEYRDFLKVHLPKHKQTETGAAIHQKPVGSRKTYYTDEQELFE